MGRTRKSKRIVLRGGPRSAAKVSVKRFNARVARRRKARR